MEKIKTSENENNNFFNKHALDSFNELGLWFGPGIGSGCEEECHTDGFYENI